MARIQHTSATDNPGTVPIRDAATVMIVRDNPQFQVLMVQRASRAVFGASAWVFPGGRVDSGDGANAADGASPDGSNNVSTANVEDPAGKGGEPWKTAAVRETLEEAGILLATSAPIDDADVVQRLRRAVLHEDVELASALRDQSIELNLSEVHEVGRFITPNGPPRRFDTWFYLARTPEGHEATPDGSEVVRARWVSPSHALELWGSEEFPLMSVTHRMLACLRRYTSVDHVVSHAASTPERRRVRVNDPDGAYEVLLPEDPGYDTAELEVEHGWVRL